MKIVVTRSLKYKGHFMDLAPILCALKINVLQRPILFFSIFLVPPSEGVEVKNRNLNIFKIFDSDIKEMSRSFKTVSWSIYLVGSDLDSIS